MSRELRRVPFGYEPPSKQYSDGVGPRPMYDRTYAEAAEAWLENVRRWADGTHPSLRGHPERKEVDPYWWDYDGDPPNREDYRPEWPADAALGYRVYETVSEGTPISPTFATLDEVRSWLLDQGYSPTAADGFLAHGWAPSLLVDATASGTTIRADISAWDAPAEGGEDGTTEGR